MITFDFEKYSSLKMEKISLEKKEEIKKKFLTEDNMKGWYYLNIKEEEITDIEKTAIKVKENCDVFLVIGIGGSFLGAKALYEAMKNPYKLKKPEIIFAGTTFSKESLHELKEYLKDKDVIINVISKSGNTLETLLTFHEMYDFLKTKYQEEKVLNKHIIITTNDKNGKLHDFALDKDIKTFTIADDIGGRFSVLTSVGLLPLAVAGFNIRALLEGAKTAKKDEDKAYTYAYLRDILYQNGKEIEAFTIYDEKLLFFTEWLKQLFAESQGKKQRGLFPVSILYSRDLHSLGQYFQEGKPLLFETHIRIKQADEKFNNLEEKLQESVCQSHLENENPSFLITIDQKTEWNFGYLIFFFFLADMMGSYLLDVSYYNQEGVEVYKKKLKESLETDKELKELFNIK